MKMTGRGMSLPLDSFEIIRKIRALFWENHRKDQAFSGQWNLRIIFSQCAWKVIFFAAQGLYRASMTGACFCCYPAWIGAYF